MDAVVFHMTDAMSRGDYGFAMTKLQQLLKMQEEPIGILGAIGNHFRRLSTARTLLDNGRNASELMKLCGMQDYAARKTMDAARRFQPEFLKKSMELILETDIRMKTSFDDKERLLEMLVLQLAQEARSD
jgi:DNA polymerase-3 subunit delta